MYVEIFLTFEIIIHTSLKSFLMLLTCDEPVNNKYFPVNLDIQEHGLRTPGEEIAFTARPKIQSQSQIFRYGGSIFYLPHWPKFSDIFDLCLHWMSVVRDVNLDSDYTVGYTVIIMKLWFCKILPLSCSFIHTYSNPYDMN